MDKSTLHQQLTDLGLERIEYTEKSVYKFDIYNDATSASYPLTLTTFTSEQGNTTVHFHEADFQENEFVPLQVRRTALDKLIELERLCNGSAGRSLAEANNGSMAQDMDEMKKLGNEMKHMKTNSELLEKNMVPDPIQ
ncbi:hypothetical protein M5X11_08380 [Paenibacillus alginolyticus]|uniref:Uncharacterized protein n=1 Tax=Paenibacillus alginolyticus TaxID=59839 RepID=A0ABT4GIP1_9BACL|nr:MULTISPECIES: hypothetical protein [Paenibacillus]MCY9664971.1 hypothetical protein [Paenibacillus alginolyticus]MCY9696074.1 hypothetical protein [Paenibacillus alginolyticus]MEC0147478.1 hypothetical protein [Paenibacillus alginolyticus]NRF92188.1 hypothetical protein [Paenibacillus frigoriresistens]